MWDTAGRPNDHPLRTLSYMSWDAVFICFSIETDMNLISVLSQVRGIQERNGGPLSTIICRLPPRLTIHLFGQWAVEFRNTCKEVPLFVVALKSDIRSDTPDRQATLCNGGRLITT